MRVVRAFWKNPVLACVAMALAFFAARVAFAVDAPKPAVVTAAPAASPASVAAVQAPTPPAQPKVHYSLRGLKPLGISQHSVPSRTAQREYIRFQNEQGSHVLIYEEAQSAPGLGELKHFREIMGKWEMVCGVELDCKMAAFCTGNCKNFYYEMSNTPEDLGLLDRNHCTMLTYRCEKPSLLPVASAANGTH